MSAGIPFKDQIKSFEFLQETDLKIDGLKRKKTELPLALKSAQETYLKIESWVTAKRGGITEIEKIQKQTQAALDLNVDRLARSEQKLSGIGNSQEFNAINKEIDQIKKMNQSLKEQVDKSQADINAILAEISAKDSELEKARADKAHKESEMAGISEQLDKEIASLMAERQTHVAKIERSLLAKYDRIRGVKAGIGISPAIAGRCSACNMLVPPQLFNQVQRAAEAHQCPSCHRILFVP